MSFSLGPGGGVQDPEILRLLAELTQLVHANNSDGCGPSAPAVVGFVEKHKDVVFVDQISNHMHTFKELADAMAPLIQGIRLDKPKNLPGDEWGGSARKDPDEPADWWK